MRSPVEMQSQSKERSTGPSSQHSHFGCPTVMVGISTQRSGMNWKKGSIGIQVARPRPAVAAWGGTYSLARAHR